MSKPCAICCHPCAVLINADLASGRSIPEVSLKHFGHHQMRDALRCHKRSHMPEIDASAKGKSRDNLVTRTEWLNRRARRWPRQGMSALDFDPMPDNLVIATEPVRIKGVVYPTGTEIPESAWDPDYLAVALRLGTVRRKAS